MSAVNQYKQRCQPEVNRLTQQNVLFWGSHGYKRRIDRLKLKTREIVERECTEPL